MPDVLRAADDPPRDERHKERADQRLDRDRHTAGEAAPDDSTFALGPTAPSKSGTVSVKAARFHGATAHPFARRCAIDDLAKRASGGKRAEVRADSPSIRLARTRRQRRRRVLHDQRRLPQHGHALARNSAPAPRILPRRRGRARVSQPRGDARLAARGCDLVAPSGQRLGLLTKSA